MTKSTKKKYFNKEEKELIDSVEKGDWKSTRSLAKQLEEAKKAAKQTLDKKKQINIRLNQRDYLGIKLKAAEEGLPYQTLISSLIHKYITGKLS